MQYYGTLALIADCAFILSIEGLSKNGMIYFIFVTVLVFQSFIICRGIEKINDLVSYFSNSVASYFAIPLNV